MTEAAKLSKGVRVQLPPATVVRCNDFAVVRFDGSDTTNSIELSTIAKATVLPRELKVGDWVLTPNPADRPCEVLAIRGDDAVLWRAHGIHSAFTLPVSSLTLDPDHKDDGE